MIKVGVVQAIAVGVVLIAGVMYVRGLKASHDRQIAVMRQLATGCGEAVFTVQGSVSE